LKTTKKEDVGILNSYLINFNGIATGGYCSILINIIFTLECFSKADYLCRKIRALSWLPRIYPVHSYLVHYKYTFLQKKKHNCLLLVALIVIF